MIYPSQKMQLKEVRIVKKGEVNDIVICQDIGSEAGSLYTLMVIREHGIAKRFLEIFEEADIPLSQCYLECFSYQGVFYVVFPYKRERPLFDFYMGESYSLQESEDICIHLILSCISAGIPYPMLYLILEQGQLHLAQDHSVYFSYQIDLKELDKDRDERDCVVQCAKILLKLLESKASQKAVSYRLLEKKIDKRSYQKFTELYKDVRVAAAPKKRRGIKAIISAFLKRNKDLLFAILLRICIVLIVIVIISFVSQVIFGDIPWLRIFINGFKQIGTESLLQ